MDPFTMAAIGTGLGTAAGIWGQSNANKTNRDIAREQMQFQREMATNAQAFSERMSSTAVQRSVADYKAAGLNPALAYERSSSSPTGVMAGGSSAHVENIMRDAPSAVSNAIALKQMRATFQLTEQQRDATAAAAKKTRIEGANEELRGRLLHETFQATKREAYAKALLSELVTGPAAVKNQLGELLQLPLSGWGNIRSNLEAFKDYDPAWWAKIKNIKPRGK